MTIFVQKIPAGKLLLCKTEVERCENRKLWMKATVCDGETGKVSNAPYLFQDSSKSAYSVAAKQAKCTSGNAAPLAAVQSFLDSA